MQGLCAIFVLFVSLMASSCAPAWATITGLNQIPTPDVQPVGLLSVGLQDENRAIQSPRQVQLELGLTDSFAIAVYQGASPVKTVLNAQVSLCRCERFLVSAGVLGTDRSTTYLPFVEAGYDVGDAQFIAGVLRQDAGHVGFLGVSYEVNSRFSVIADYIGESSSFSSVGVVCQITPTLSFNPAIYISNTTLGRCHGYASLTWDVRVW